jgi:hypothetical protein
MRFFEFKSIKPLTPEQGRIAALQRNIEFARFILKRERQNQKRQRANLQLQKLSVPKIQA